jgi:hypothetical protein
MEDFINFNYSPKKERQSVLIRVFLIKIDDSTQFLNEIFYCNIHLFSVLYRILGYRVKVPVQLE